MSEEREIKTRNGRVGVFLEFINKNTGLTPFRWMQRLTIQQTLRLEPLDEELLAKVVKTETKKSDLLVGEAWQAFDDAIDAVFDALGEPAGRGHWRFTNYTPDDRTRVVETNVTTILESPQYASDLFALFSGIELLHELLEGIVEPSINDIMRHPDVKTEGEPGNAWKRFWNVEWYRGGEWPMDRLRNSWAHGWVEVRGSEAVLHGPTGNERGRSMTAGEVRGHLQAAFATYEAFTLASAHALALHPNEPQ